MREEGVISTVHPGIKLRLHPRDWIEYLLLRGESYEPLTLKFLTANLRSGDCAVLAGVNFGLHVAVAARAVGSSGFVVGFEPQPAALLRAHANLLLNGLSDQVRLVAAALGSEDGVMPMPWSQPGNSGAVSLLDEGAGLSVCVAPLSQLLPQVCPNRPRILLLDVQGYELHAMLGVAPESAPALAIVEFDQGFLNRAGVAPEVLYARLLELGYTMFSLHGEPVPTGEVNVPEGNIVGVREGVTVNWLSRPAG